MSLCIPAISVELLSFYIYLIMCISASLMQPRSGSRTATISKMERFVIIVNGWRQLTIITKRSILDFAAVLDPPLQPATLT